MVLTMVTYSREKWKILKINYLILFFIILIGIIKPIECTVEEIEATPTNTNGIELGELSLIQFILLIFVFLKLTVLYSMGVLPLEIDLGGMLDETLREKRSLRKVNYHYCYLLLYQKYNRILKN